MAVSLAVAATLIVAPSSGAAEPVDAVRIGSKKFTESVILGEMMTLLVRDAGVPAVHRRELGGTRVLWNAVKRGGIDAYVDYTGTVRREILGREDALSLADLRAAVAPDGVRVSDPLGFDNSYALGMRPELADSLGIVTISDLRRYPQLRLGFTSEFMARQDGWPGLRRTYDLPHTDVRGLDHDLAYRGLAAATLDVTDFYATDAEIALYGLRILTDDRDHFPDYQAVILMRDDLTERAPSARRALERLEGRIDVTAMTRLNRAVRSDRRSERSVAAGFLRRELGVAVVDTGSGSSWLARLARHTREHLVLVGISLLAAVIAAVPLGVLAARKPRVGQGILGFAGILQTIPALALLVFMIPLLGIGGPPAVVALFVYSLLPILRNTHAGLTDIAPEIRESAAALGLPAAAVLWRIELPLASRAILAGIKTSAVINVGTATLGALIGAGGYGQPILTGIRLDDVGLILQGAVPAALLALAMQGFFDLAERALVPRGLRLTDPG
jgi:osmoprotectant transport system permease protein